MGMMMAVPLANAPASSCSSVPLTHSPLLSPCPSLSRVVLFSVPASASAMIVEQEIPADATLCTHECQPSGRRYIAPTPPSSAKAVSRVSIESTCCCVETSVAEQGPRKALCPLPAPPGTLAVILSDTWHKNTHHVLRLLPPSS